MSQLGKRKYVESSIGEIIDQFEQDVPLDAQHRFSEFKGMAAQPRICIFCLSEFTKRDSGMLSCKFHPSAYINKGVRFAPYSRAKPSHTDCKECARLTQFSGEIRGELPEHQKRHSGCTRIDHTDSLEILGRPFIAIPVAYLSEMNIFADAKTVSSGGYTNEDTVRILKARRNVKVIDKAKKLGCELVIDMPGTGFPFVVSVLEVYENMAQTFGIPCLDDEIRASMLMNPELKPSKHGSMYAKEGAGTFDRIRTMESRNVFFMPMVIIARIDQTTPGSSGMHLRKPRKPVTL